MGVGQEQRIQHDLPAERDTLGVAFWIKVENLLSMARRVPIKTLLEPFSSEMTRPSVMSIFMEYTELPLLLEKEGGNRGREQGEARGGCM